MAKISIAGTTSWGTTLAIILSREGLDVTLWARSEQEASNLRSLGRNPKFLSDQSFPTRLKIASSANEAFHDASVSIIAVPSNSLRTNIKSIRDSLESSAAIVSASKGLEISSGKRMSQVLEDELPHYLHDRICALSGPNLSKEIVAGKPSSTVVACKNNNVTKMVQELLTSSKFRIYTNTDIIGVELGGSLKNIIAIGAGICDGLSYGDNSKAAFITRGLAEITRLGISAGAKPITFAGLAGMGDLIATCSSKFSRNHYVGEELAKGRSVNEIQASMKNVAEGISTTSAAIMLAKKLHVEMPITQATYKILYENMHVGKAVAYLMGRAPLQE